MAFSGAPLLKLVKIENVLKAAVLAVQESIKWEELVLGAPDDSFDCPSHVGSNLA